MASSMREESGALRDYWYAAARVEEVGPSRPLARRILGVPLVLWRSPEGTPVCAVDRCLHRNMPLSRGEMVDGKLGCAYHGWLYDGTGRCVSVPAEGPDDAGYDGGRLETFPAQDRYGLVWVWMGNEKSPAREPFPMPNREAAGWRFFYLETRLGNDVTNVVENFMDVPHTMFVHKGWFRRRTGRRMPTRVERTRDAVVVTYDQPRDSIGFSRWVLNPRGLPLFHTDRFHMPNIVQVEYVFGDAERALSITSTCTPVTERETLAFTRIGFRLGAFTPIARWVLPPYTRHVIGQDAWVVEAQGENLRRHGGPEFHSTRADRMHVHIRALRDWAREGGSAPPPEPRSEDIAMWI